MTPTETKGSSSGAGTRSGPDKITKTTCIPLLELRFLNPNAEIPFAKEFDWRAFAKLAAGHLEKRLLALHVEKTAQGSAGSGTVVGGTIQPLAAMSAASGGGQGKQCDLVATTFEECLVDGKLVSCICDHYECTDGSSYKTCEQSS